MGNEGVHESRGVPTGDRPTPAGSACRTGCPTQDHATYRDCLKDMSVAVTAGDSAPASYPTRTP